MTVMAQLINYPDLFIYSSYRVGYALTLWCCVYGMVFILIP
jgi:hypothetical protein